MADQPSQNIEEDYLKSYNNTDRNNLKPVMRVGEDGEPFDDSGFWIIFKPVEQIDQAWDIVRSATEQGDLGYMSSVRTVKILPVEPAYDEKAVFVFTYDSKDEADIARVGDALEQMGFHGFAYKRRLDTKNKIYYHLGDTDFCTHRR